MERTDKIPVNQQEDRTNAALDMTDAFISEQGMTGKKAIHLRLLVEETLGMVRAMTHDFQGVFWIEEEEGVYEIKLLANTEMNKGKKDGLLSVSKTGTNVSAKGFMAKIGDFFENGILYFNDVMKIKPLPLDEDSEFMDYVSMGFCMPSDLASDTPQMMQAQMIWSLNQYRESLEEAPREEKVVQTAWDELEKSIVASIAGDVIVGVKKNRMYMKIIAPIDAET
ncbi:MAG: hypothetical protein Q4D81_05240 [Eubacteriales bacterium]|nr:hypothetical protein [Eubacteriales bacterium]